MAIVKFVILLIKKKNKKKKAIELKNVGLIGKIKDNTKTSSPSILRAHQLRINKEAAGVSQVSQLNFRLRNA